MQECTNAQMQDRGGAKAARWCIVAFLHLCILCVSPLSVLAGERYAVVITGAAGGDSYAQKYDAWRAALVGALRDRFDYQGDRLTVLADQESDRGGGTLTATRANVQSVLGRLKVRMNAGDQLLVVLIGHGTVVDAEDAKFNLVGPDLSASEWAALLKPIAGRLVFVDTASGSYPFLRALAARGRIVLTANDSASQQFETVFPEFFIKAFSDSSADADKDGKVSVWEAFAYASSGVRRWYADQGRLPAERPLLDDTGVGAGRAAETPGRDGAVAKVTYFGN
jgi:hypothetical protein